MTFQGSETSGVVVTVYAQKRLLPFLSQPREVLKMTGRRAEDDEPMVIDVSTSKMMGAGAGGWNVVVKAPSTKKYPDLRKLVLRGDWIDISFTRFNRQWLCMRGIIDTVRRVKQSVSGATVVQYVISGRDFVKAWEDTPIWFNRFTAENAGGSVGNRIYSGQNFTGPVDATVEGILFGFMQALSSAGRSSWQPPKNIPNTTDGSFVNSVIYNTDAFSNDPVRWAVSPSLMDPYGAGAWDLAKTWSDPCFCELFGDIVVGSGELPQDGSEVKPEDAAMGMILRDIPFPTTEDGLDSPYFSLPLHLIDQSNIELEDLGTSDFEHFNAFFVGPQVNQEFGASALVELTQPAWDPADIALHGVRRYDVVSNYTVQEPDLLTLTRKQRSRVRDWYCMNSLFLSGQLPLNRGYPEIRIGQRLRVKGATPDEDLTFYVEGVNHNWRARQGMKTMLVVTRGWEGTDASYMSALDQTASRFTDAPAAKAADFTRPPSDTSIV